jgi:NTF2 fold immunity protein of polymorphic toxin system component
MIIHRGRIGRIGNWHEEYVNMKRITLMISLFAALIATVYGQPQRMPSVKPKEGFVPNAETAVKVGEAVLMPVYGEKQIFGERPFKAALHGDVWTVEGTLHCGGQPDTECHGGTAVVKISKTSGQILYMMHYK